MKVYQVYFNNKKLATMFTQVTVANRMIRLKQDNFHRATNMKYCINNPSFAKLKFMQMLYPEDVKVTSWAYSD